jgi:hypothetical protein
MGGMWCKVPTLDEQMHLKAVCSSIDWQIQAIDIIVEVVVIFFSICFS